MAPRDVNRMAEMEVFVQAVDLGGFAAAARAAGLTPSAVSKLVARMEDRLGARLLVRSTRWLELTAEGCLFYERARRILADVRDAEAGVARGAEPAGHIRLNTSASYATHVLAPVLPGFLALNPKILVDVVLTDAVVDLVADRCDVAVRAGAPKASTLTARRLGASPLVAVAAPAYLDRHGTPACPDDLRRHRILGFGYARAAEAWTFRDGNGTATTSLLPPAAVRVSDGEGLRRLAVAGAGIARLAHFAVRADLEAGRLVPVLPDRLVAEAEDFHAVHVGQGGPVPTRVRVLLDFLARHGRVA